MPIDYSKYPVNWKTEIRPKILKRAENKCEGSPNFPLCRAENYMEHPTTGSKVILTIAHFDQDLSNNNYSEIDKNAEGNNLFAWCQRCHLDHDKNQRANSRKYGKDWEENQTKMKL